MSNRYVESIDRYGEWLTKTSRGICFIAFSLYLFFSGYNYYHNARQEAEKNKRVFTRMINTQLNETTTLRSMNDALKEILNEELGKSIEEKR
ncbi:hypothetical protein COU61_05075 [Candidatus Pacearchaeota archaeon CG10_big_fil_rev_8_21_14_0_10_35_13]|nr:MAG: hypothetical protein COU61_05075 [Candidatus Pacearchaeota archaeon CG10_big_fil_rev_8_21_14_0_10_35_13]